MFENIVGFISGILQQLQQFWQEYKIGEQIVNGIQYVDGIVQSNIPHSYLRIGIACLLILMILGALFRGRKGNERIVYKAHPCVMRKHPFLSILGLSGCAIGLFGIGNRNSVPFYSAGALGGLILLVL